MKDFANKNCLKEQTHIKTKLDVIMDKLTWATLLLGTAYTAQAVLESFGLLVLRY